MVHWAHPLMSSIRNFLYRPPRFDASCRVDFISGDTILLGACVEVSESGLRVTFAGVTKPQTQGLITLYLDNRAFSAHAVIVEVHDEEAAVGFEYQSPQEETGIREFIKLLSTRSTS